MPVATSDVSSNSFMGWSMVRETTSGSASKAGSAFTGTVSAMPLTTWSLVVQAGAKALHSTLLLRLRSLFVLHDDIHGLTSRRTMGSRGNGREVRSELAHEPAVASRILGESGSGNQDKQHAQALSPSCAMTLVSTRALRFQSVQHKSHLSCLVQSERCGAK